MNGGMLPRLDCFKATPFLPAASQPERRAPEKPHFQRDNV
jgi:hypothetical protein